MKQKFLNACRELVGNQYVLTESQQLSSFVTDARKRYSGKALAIVKPTTTEQVAGIVRLCNQYRVPIVTQGGNTGLVIGSVPDMSGNAIVLSMTRLNLIREVDIVNNTITVDAGCLLDTVQQAAKNKNRLFPLSLASSGSCTIGGNLATNAGGTAVLRYGNVRELCLGLEVVTAQGEIWDGLRGLRKDNTGYDLRDIYIGSEGTLGIITAAVLKIFPLPRTSVTTFIGLKTVKDAVSLLQTAQEVSQTNLTAFELMSNYCLQLVMKHFPHLSSPLLAPCSQYVLMELLSHESKEHIMLQLEQILDLGLKKGFIEDAAMAQSMAQSKNIWQLRENLSDAQALEGKNIKHDISVPVSCIVDFLDATEKQLKTRFPGCSMVTFGHLGDGSLHYNVAAPDTMTDDDFFSYQNEINRIVYENVKNFRGSISAEHGLGAMKCEENNKHKSPVELALMRKIKKALDPLDLMNPGKVLFQN